MNNFDHVEVYGNSTVATTWDIQNTLRHKRHGHGLNLLQKRECASYTPVLVNVFSSAQCGKQPQQSPMAPAKLHDKIKKTLKQLEERRAQALCSHRIPDREHESCAWQLFAEAFSSAEP